MKAIKNYFLLTWEIKKADIMSAMEYRVNFLSQIFFMMLNNSAWVVLWWIFFAQFPEINGWKFQDSMFIFALSSSSFGLLMIFFGGAPEISRIVARGELDRFFFYPKSILWQASISRTHISAIGDYIFGIVLFFFCGNASVGTFFLFLLFSFISALIFFNFIVLFQSIAFFAGNFEEAAEQMFWQLLGFGFYPQAAFYGVLQIIMFTILPAFFVFALPLELARTFDGADFMLLIMFWLFTFILANFVFRLGIRRYESGNMMSVNL